MTINPLHDKLSMVCIPWSLYNNSIDIFLTLPTFSSIDEYGVIVYTIPLILVTCYYQLC